MERPRRPSGHSHNSWALKTRGEDTAYNYKHVTGTHSRADHAGWCTTVGFQKERSRSAPLTPDWWQAPGLRQAPDWWQVM